jgi:hypothetical protein
MEKPRPPDKEKPDTWPLTELVKAMRGLVGFPKTELEEQRKWEERDKQKKEPYRRHRHVPPAPDL